MGGDDGENTMISPHSWEMPPGYVVRNSFIHRAPLKLGREIEWQLHVIEVPNSKFGFLWMCPLDVPTDAGLVAYDSIFNFGETMLCDVNATRASSKTMLDYVFEKANIARQLFLNEAGTLRRDDERAHEAVIFAPDGRAVWSQTFAQGDKRYPAHFRWSEPMSPADFLRVPVQTLLDRLQELLADPNGEVVFARRWAFTTKAERDELSEKTARGNVEELKEWMRDILLASTVWDENPDARRINLSLSRSKTATIWDEDGEWGESLPMPPSLAQNAEKLRACFQPFHERIAGFMCVQRSDAGPIVVYVARPTAHERTEAMIRWREWEARL